MCWMMLAALAPVVSEQGDEDLIVVGAACELDGLPEHRFLFGAELAKCRRAAHVRGCDSRFQPVRAERIECEVDCREAERTNSPLPHCSGARTISQSAEPKPGSISRKRIRPASRVLFSTIDSQMPRRLRRSNAAASICSAKSAGDFGPGTIQAATRGSLTMAKSANASPRVASRSVTSGPRSTGACVSPCGRITGSRWSRGPAHGSRNSVVAHDYYRPSDTAAPVPGRLASPSSSRPLPETIVEPHTMFDPQTMLSCPSPRRCSWRRTPDDVGAPDDLVLAGAPDDVAAVAVAARAAPDDVGAPDDVVLREPQTMLEPHTMLEPQTMLEPHTMLGAPDDVVLARTPDDVVLPEPQTMFSCPSPRRCCPCPNPRRCCPCPSPRRCCSSPSPRRCSSRASPRRCWRPTRVPHGMITPPPTR